MSWNAHGFTRGFEAGIFGLAAAAGRAAAAEREIDRSGGQALSHVARALRMERAVRIATEQKLAATEAELLAVYKQLEAAQLKLRSARR